MKNLITLLILPLVMTTLACSESLTFTAGEIDIINRNDSLKIMKLYIVDNPSDTIVLREIAPDLNRADIKSEHFLKLKERMLATVQDSTNPGVGLAAPQVGVSKRLIVVQRLDKRGEPYKFYINPRIEFYSPECELGPEGCLSVPGMSGEVMRSKKIVVSYTDEKSFKTRRDTVEGYTAVIFQHEIDHLEGILYTDRISAN